MPSSHLILCRPLLLLPPIPPSIRVFSTVRQETIVFCFFHLSTFLVSMSLKKKEEKFVLCLVLMAEGKIGSFHVLVQDHSTLWFLWRQVLPQCWHGRRGAFILTAVMYQLCQLLPGLELRLQMLLVPALLSSPRPSLSLL